MDSVLQVLMVVALVAGVVFLLLAVLDTLRWAAGKAKAPSRSR